MARHDPELTKAFEVNRAAISVASISETAMQNFIAMSPAERRFKASAADIEAARCDILAGRPGHPDAEYYRDRAAQQRNVVAVLKAIGL